MPVSSERPPEEVPAASVSSAKHRSLSLDVLRAIAVLLVLLSHSPVAWMRAVGLPQSVARAFHQGGWMGVDLFFVLSGFLIAGLLFREHQKHGELRVGSFLLRRGFKIYPAFYVLLAATLIHHAVVSGGLHRAALVEALFLQSYFGSIWGHTWSLAVEEHFYLTLPVLLWLLCRRRRGDANPFVGIPQICLGIGFVTLALRIWTFYRVPYEPLTHLYPTHLRVDGLMFGVFLAYGYHYHRERFLNVANRYRWPLLAIGAWCILPAFLFPLRDTPFVFTLGLTQLFVGSGCLLVAFVARPVTENRFTRALGRVGFYSYSIYLWHLPMRTWGWQLANAFGVPMMETPGIAFAVYFAGSLAVGIGMAKLIEIPVLRLRDRIVPSRSGEPFKPVELRDVTLEPRRMQPSRVEDGQAEAVTR